MAEDVKVAQEVETQAAVNAVTEADQKVANLQMEKAAKKAKKHEERLAKHPKIGKFINWVDDNKIPLGVGVLIGGPLGVGGTILYNKFSKKSDAEVAVEADVEETDTEADKVPFDTES